MEYQSCDLSQISVCNHFENKLISGVGKLSAGCSSATQLNIDGPLTRQVDKWKINPCAIWGICFNLHDNISENQTSLVPLLSEQCSDKLTAFVGSFSFWPYIWCFIYFICLPLAPAFNGCLHYYSHVTKEGTRTECKWVPRWDRHSRAGNWSCFQAPFDTDPA